MDRRFLASFLAVKMVSKKKKNNDITNPDKGDLLPCFFLYIPYI